MRLYHSSSSAINIEKFHRLLEAIQSPPSLLYQPEIPLARRWIQSDLLFLQGFQSSALNQLLMQTGGKNFTSDLLQ